MYHEILPLGLPSNLEFGYINIQFNWYNYKYSDNNKCPINKPSIHTNSFFIRRIRKKINSIVHSHFVYIHIITYIHLPHGTEKKNTPVTNIMKVNIKQHAPTTKTISYSSTSVLMNKLYFFSSLDIMLYMYLCFAYNF